MNKTSPTTAASISVQEVYGIIKRTVLPTGRIETVSLDAALGHFLAEDIVSTEPMPAFNNSAMDGYAFNSTLLQSTDKLLLRVSGASFAGAPAAEHLVATAALKVTTGARVPDIYDTVIPYELVDSKVINGNEYIEFERQSIKPKANMRLQGEEIKKGTIVLHNGTHLGAAEIGLAAALGRSHLKCRIVKVAVFATGDELTAPGQPLRPGCIYDVNSHLIEASVKGWGFDIQNLGILPDDPNAQRNALQNAIQNYDFLVTSGGVGESEKDFTTKVLAEFGDVNHYFVRMRPGKPFSLGSLETQGHRIYFVALPGNPVAAAISGKLFLREALFRSAGAQAPIEHLKATTATNIKGRIGRTDFVRGSITFKESGYVFQPAHSQSSAMLTSLINMNAMAILDEDTAGATENDIIDIIRMPD